jgi:acetyl-CoA C-acetyltransferase
MMFQLEFPPMRRAAIVSPIRTAVGKFQGALSSITAGDLGAVVIKALMERTGIDPERIDDVTFSQGYPNGEAPCIARWSLLAAGLPLSIPGVSMDRRCGSGLQAVIDAAMRIQTGAADVVLAGGVESMSNVEYYSTDMRNGARAGSVTMHDRLARGRVMSQPVERFGVISGMIETADNLAAMKMLRAGRVWVPSGFFLNCMALTAPRSSTSMASGSRPSAN